MAETLGNARQAAVCRELTKRFEEVTRGTLGDLAAAFANRDVKGEIVIVVDRAPVAVAGVETIARELDKAMQTLSLKDASAAVATALGLPRRDVYQLALTRGDRR